MYRACHSPRFHRPAYLSAATGERKTQAQPFLPVEVLLRGTALNQHGYLADIVEVDRAVTEIIAQFSGHTLNDLKPFAGLNPSLEHFARVFYEDLHARLALQDLSLAVKLWENDRDWAAYGPE